jgi:transposase
LKTLKRQMYGRAGFELLRARLLPMARGSTLHRN